jgi:hypothetical protein
MNALVFRRPARPLGASMQSADGAGGMALATIERLISTLDDEMQQIAKRQAVDYQEFNLRKSQALLELSRLTPALSSSSARPALRSAFARLRAKLEASRRVLRLQLNAAQAVSNLLSRAIQEGQSDGTYSAFDWRD